MAGNGGGGLPADFSAADPPIIYAATREREKLKDVRSKEMKSTQADKPRNVPSWTLFCWSLALILLGVTVFGQEKPGQSEERIPVDQKKLIRGIEENISLRVNTHLVSLPVIVTDRKGNLVNGLERNDFSVYDDGALQKIELFSVDDSPASIVVLFDASGSMSGKKIDRAKQSLVRFVQTSHPMDEFFLIGFNTRPQLLLDSTRDADEILTKLIQVEPRGETALYDSIYLGVEKVLDGAHPKKVLLMITDGGDNHSRYTLGMLTVSCRNLESLFTLLEFLRTCCPSSDLWVKIFLKSSPQTLAEKHFFLTT
ncbi:MAG: VWA domain-containing protein [Chloracidobacterium sp.]|nr:VWA domain-containing protein [Chloracidobacterium sp.]